MSLPRSYFDDLYAISPDPWGFLDRPYERRKRALTLAALPDEHYATAYEPGCSIGVLTAQLQERCGAVLASDVSDAALAAAATRVGPAVTLQRRGVADWPESHFDLVVVSELGYYLGPGDCAALAAAAFGGGDTVLAVHWRHPVPDYPLLGDTVHQLFEQAARTAGHHHLTQLVEPDLRLDVWSTDPRSNAQRTGLRS